MGNHPSLASSPVHSISVWLPIISAGTRFLPSAGTSVARELSKIVSLLASLAVKINKEIPITRVMHVMSCHGNMFPWQSF